MRLSKAEEQLMELIWKHGKVFMKELLETYPDPKPATTTIATLLKRMQEKGFVGFTLYGTSRQYYPLIDKAAYFSKHVKGIIKSYFDDSPMQFASFFTRSTDLTTSELEELRRIVDQELKRKRK